MKHTMLFLALVTISAIALAQGGSPGKGGTAPYEPVVPSASVTNYGGYGGYGGYNTGGSTPAGSAMNGMASVISAKGDYNLSTSAAAVNMTQAQHNEIQNRQEWTDTYFQMRATNRAATAAERGPKPTMAQLVKIAQEGVPQPISPSQMDPVSGAIAWPAVLKTDLFTPQRTEVDQLLAKRATHGGLAYGDQMKVRQAIDNMFDEMKAQIREIPPADYVASRNFLQSLTYAVTKSDI